MLPRNDCWHGDSVVKNKIEANHLSLSRFRQRFTPCAKASLAHATVQSGAVGVKVMGDYRNFIAVNDGQRVERKKQVCVAPDDVSPPQC